MLCTCVVWCIHKGIQVCKNQRKTHSIFYHLVPFALRKFLSMNQKPGLSLRLSGQWAPESTRV